MKKLYLLLFIVSLLISNCFGQVGGSKFVPGDYPTLAVAINTLNTVGVAAGGATINVAAGLTETAPTGGYVLGSLSLNATLSASNPLTIRKNPATFGANPLLTAPVGTSTSVDGIFTLQGADYTTINGIDLQESPGNTSSTTRLMEWGYGLVKLSASDGCQNTSIINCIITLQKVLLHTQSAIYAGNHLLANTTSLVITSASGRNDNNKIYNNTILSCAYIPINFNGYNAGPPYTYYDQGNDIGGNSAATGNTIIDYGGLAGGSFYVSNFGIAAVYQNNLNISNNNITQATDGLGFVGIYPFGTNGTFTCNNNIISGSGMCYSSAPSLHAGIYSNASGANLTANNNNINAIISGSFTGRVPVYGINMYSTGDLTATGNTISTTQTVNADMYGVYSAATGNVNISSNTINAASTSVTNNIYCGINTDAAASAQTISNNVFGTVNVSNTTGNVYLINADNNSSNVTCSNNSVSGSVTKAGSGGLFYGFYNYGSPSGGTAVISGNNFSDISVAGTTAFFGIRQFTTTSQVETISNNTIARISAGSGALYGISIGYGNTGSSVSGNEISGFSGTGSITGIYLGDSYLSNAMLCHSNTVYNLRSTGAANVTGITSSLGLATSIYKNKIYDLEDDNSSGNVYGISITGGTSSSTNTIYNNLIGDLRSPSANSTSDMVRGISITSTATSSDIKLYHNTIYLNSSSTGTNFSSSGIYQTYVNSSSKALLDLRNNIIVNISTCKGSGIAAAFRRSANNNLKNYSSSSDNNLFYAGTPSANRLIFYNNSSYQTIATFKTAVSPSDNSSISSVVNFISTTGSSADFLHLNECALDNKGAPIAGFTSDFDDETRSSTVPDIGADEFAGLSGSLAGLSGSAVCSSIAVVNSGIFYTDASCNLIAKVIPSGALPVTGIIKSCVTIDATQQYFYGEPYVQRHIDIEPATLPATRTATVLLYFTDAEFTDFNTNNPAWPKLPTVAGGGNADFNRANLRITQFHGTPTGGLPATWPGNYTGARKLIVPGAANVYWTGSYWQITINVTGFSGFYAHSNTGFAILPVTLNYFNGSRQNNSHILNWKVTCNSAPNVTITLERSSEFSRFTGIHSITADALRCNQPFDYTDANPLNGMNYYRLKMTDADGKITYSSTVALRNAAKGFDIISIAPNPVTADGNFKLNIASAQSSKLDIRILDMQGRIVNRQIIPVTAGSNSIPMNVGKLAAGTYNIYGLMDGDKSRVIRFVKQ